MAGEQILRQRTSLALTPPEPKGTLRLGRGYVNTEAQPLASKHKRIVVCADGTWNTPHQTNGGAPAPTNVWLLWQLVRAAAEDDVPQLAYYHPGIGSGGTIDRILGGAFGVGLSRNIKECYRFLVEHYHRGDHVYLFGFSRGAYTVRSLAGLVRNAGIIDRSRFIDRRGLDSAIDRAYSLYRRRDRESAPASAQAVEFRAAHSHPDFRLTCLGVWDTVGALGIPVGFLGRLSQLRWGFHDVTLSSWVDRAFHAVAVDERRRPFQPTLWEQQPDARMQGQVLEQVWFSGSHCDVGGGYDWRERGLASQTLAWMVDRVTQFCALDLDLDRLADALSQREVIHDSMSQWYRAFRPLPRVLDGPLLSSGRRDLTRQTQERMHDSVRDFMRRYASTPFPRLPHPYAPDNVSDYERRLQAAAALADVPALSYHSDARTPMPQ